MDSIKLTIPYLSITYEFLIFFKMFKDFPHFRQRDAMDCGPTCLMMIAKHHGKDYSLPYLREFCYLKA